MAQVLNHVMAIVFVIGLAPSVLGQTFELVHSFQGFDGERPSSELIQAMDGSFYGTTVVGGSEDMGTVFQMTIEGTITTLITFDEFNGERPFAPLIQLKNGNFYGTTWRTVFQISSNGVLTTLVAFFGDNGSDPIGRLIEGIDGKLYGTTENGGIENDTGTIFQIIPDGLLTTFFFFDERGGGHPSSGLTLGNDGNFYGTTSRSGTNGGFGTVYRMTPSGVKTVLKTFNGFNGRWVRGGLEVAVDGSLYGTTSGGGTNSMGDASDSGTVFRITTNGELTTIVSFAGTNGAVPHAGVLRGSDGNLYGTTKEGGRNDLGTVFRVTTNGVLTTLVTFDGTNGATPRAGLMQASDGDLYGTTSGGGANNYGTVFRIVMPVTLNLLAMGNELVLSWPTNAIGFTLQSALNLNPSTNWIDFTNSPAVVGGKFVVTNFVSGTGRFYRLKKP